MPELPAIAPISRNIGIADRSQFAAKTNGVSRSDAERDIEVAQIPEAERTRPRPSRRRSARAARSAPASAPRLTSDERERAHDARASRCARRRAAARDIARSRAARGRATMKHAGRSAASSGSARPGCTSCRPARPRRRASGASAAQKRLVGEHGHVDAMVKIFTHDLEPEVEARRADVLEHAGDDVIVVARDPGPGQIGDRPPCSRRRRSRSCLRTGD